MQCASSDAANVGCAGCAMDTGPALWRPKFYHTVLSRLEPQISRELFRVNTFLATMDRACTQINERFLSMNSVAMTFGILFRSLHLAVSF